ncbi:MAG: fatty acid desaturase [Bdellovibrionia bacterium]
MKFDTKKIYWPVTLFILINIVAALILTPIYLYYAGFSWGLWLFALVFAAATNLSITAGYHRLFSHKSYDAHPFVKWIYLLIGASAWQGSALKWSSDHRRHHTHIDSEKDPYNIERGFWFAHMGWMFLKETVDQPIHAPDLVKDSAVKLQDKYFIPLGIFMGYIVPGIIGALFFDSFWGGFIIAGSLRIALTQQSTFFVNSLCHTLGKQTYSKDISARDSFIVAVLTHGEGYHNFHHTFQIDYRNGIKWYHWDPTKWVIQTLAFFSLAHKLKTIPQVEIIRAKLQADEQRLISKGLFDEKLVTIRTRILEAQAKMKTLKEEYKTLKEEYQMRHQEFQSAYGTKWANMKRDLELKLLEMHKEMEKTQLEFRVGMKQWKLYLKSI